MRSKKSTSQNRHLILFDDGVKGKNLQKRPGCKFNEAVSQMASLTIHAAITLAHIKATSSCLYYIVIVPYWIRPHPRSLQARRLFLVSGMRGEGSRLKDLFLAFSQENGIVRARRPLEKAACFRFRERPALISWEKEQNMMGTAVCEFGASKI